MGVASKRPSNTPQASEQAKFLSPKLGRRYGYYSALLLTALWILYQEEVHLHTSESWGVREACWGLREQDKICGTSILGMKLTKAEPEKPQKNCS